MTTKAKEPGSAPRTRSAKVEAARTVATPFGAATLRDEVVLSQRAGDRRFASLVQLLETTRGEQLVRFAYSTGDTTRRGPVTLRSGDLRRLRRALERHPELRAALTGR